VTAYALIDCVLSQWAEANGIHWYTEYQDVEVRTFYLNESRRDRVQIAVDPPEGEKTLVRIGQNRRGLRLARTRVVTSTVAELPQALDQALAIAKDWASP
jgi:hypothetical protein